jgi:hypothetical protein
LTEAVKQKKGMKLISWRFSEYYYLHSLVENISAYIEAFIMHHLDAVACCCRDKSLTQAQFFHAKLSLVFLGTGMKKSSSDKEFAKEHSFAYRNSRFLSIGTLSLQQAPNQQGFCVM